MKTNEINEPKPRLLIVDDQPEIFRSLERLVRAELGKERITVDTTASPRQALELIELNEYSVVLSDYLMPEMLGDALLERVKQRRPAATRIIMSGTNVDYTGKFYPETQDVPSLLPHYAVRKPFESDEMLRIIKQGISDYLMRTA
ncbi:response regulator [Candidatus Woesearchaeota archaeon]|nr:response regulator [Candidatus Woesearchaeota archaeon]